MSVLTDAPIADIPSSLCLSFLVKENNGVEVRLSSVVPYPPLTRVVRVLEVTGKGGSKADRFRRGSRSGDSRLVLCEACWFVTIDAVFTHIGLSEV